MKANRDPGRGRYFDADQNGSNPGKRIPQHGDRSPVRADPMGERQEDGEGRQRDKHARFDDPIATAHADVQTLHELFPRRGDQRE